MFSSAEIKVVDTFGSPKRLKRSRAASRIRSAVRRGALAMRQAPICSIAPSGPALAAKAKADASCRELHLDLMDGQCRQLAQLQLLRRSNADAKRTPAASFRIDVKVTSQSCLL